MQKLYFSSASVLKKSRQLVEELSRKYNLIHIGIPSELDEEVIKQLSYDVAVIIDHPSAREINRLEEELFANHPEIDFVVTRNHFIGNPVRSGRFPNVMACQHDNVYGVIKKDFSE